MAEQVNEEVTLGPVDDMDDWSGGSEQDEMVEDFADGMEEVLVDGDGKPVSTDENPQEGIEEKQEETDTTKTTDENAEEETEENADPLMADFLRDGELDADSAIDFLGIGKEPEQPIQKPVAPEPPKPPEQSQQQDGKQELDEFEQIKQDRLGWIDAINQRIRQDQAAGRQTDLVAALNEIAQQQQAQVAELINNKRFEKAQQQYEQRMKDFESQMQAKELAPKAESNLQALANQLKLNSSDKARQFLFSEQYGGEILETVFEFASQFNPEWANAKGDAKKQAYEQFLVNYTSNKRWAQTLGDFALAKLQKRMFPELIKRARGSGRAQEQASRRASNKGSSVRTRAQQKPQSKGGDPINDWFNNDDRIASL